MVGSSVRSRSIRKSKRSPSVKLTRYWFKTFNSVFKTVLKVDIMSEGRYTIGYIGKSASVSMVNISLH